MKSNGKRFSSTAGRAFSLACYAWLAALFLGVTLPLLAADAPTIYESWVKPWTEKPATSPSLGDVELKAVVSVVTGETDANKLSNLTPAERLAVAYQIRVAATEVATNGACRSYIVSNTGSEATAPNQLSAAELEKLTALLAALPSDDAKLPLAGKRVVVQTWENGKWNVHVYDGHKLPAEVKALLDKLANPYRATL
jgi:hypothetical protein